MFVRPDQRDFHRDIQGQPHAPGILLLHALGTDMAIWGAGGCLCRNARVS